MYFVNFHDGFMNIVFFWPWWYFSLSLIFLSALTLPRKTVAGSYFVSDNIWIKQDQFFLSKTFKLYAVDFKEEDIAPTIWHSTCKIGEFLIRITVLSFQRSTAQIHLWRQMQEHGNGNFNYGTSVLYTCGPYGNFLDSNGFLYEYLISTCSWDRTSRQFLFLLKRLFSS